MREIKFRIWDHGRMIYGVGLRENGTPFKDEGRYYELESDKDFEGAEVMQYTGLHDKNGKEIFEGDILMERRKMEPTDFWGPIEWHNSGFWLEEFWDGQTVPFLPSEDRREVVGNVWENPKLLEVK
jgi:uncharacterized phage protein (TIGR01671 family)